MAVGVKASLTVLKVVINPHSIGVVAELLATDEPFTLANDEVEEVVQELMMEDIEARALVRRVDHVGKGIVDIAEEISADLIFMGTREMGKREDLLPESDPIVDYVMHHSPTNIVLVRPKRST